jgi:hypothetical protein
MDGFPRCGVPDMIHQARKAAKKESGCSAGRRVNGGCRGGTEGESVNTSDRPLPDGLLELVPVLAQRIHDVWADQRASEGWRYGPRRDDLAKRHPGLVEYEALPESEREYDRAVAVEILKTLLALGYRIVR